MKVIMTKTSKGSTDGVNLNIYQTGQEYDIPDRLAIVFVEHMQVAERVIPVEMESPKQIEMEISEQLIPETPERLQIEMPAQSKIETPSKRKGTPSESKKKKKVVKK